MEKGVEGFVNMTALLGCGVYLLRHRGRVVFVGKADRGMLARLAAHRSANRKGLPNWMPLRGVIFDEIFVRRVHPDQLDEVYLALTAEYLPPRPEPHLIERRA